MHARFMPTSDYVLRRHSACRLAVVSLRALGRCELFLNEGVACAETWIPEALLSCSARLKRGLVG